MKPSRRRSDFFHKLFEATIDYTVREESPNFIGKYKVLFCPTLSRFEPLSVLFQFLKPEQFHHSGRKRQSSGFPSLGIRYKAYEGTDSATMHKGVGHFPSTSAWNGNIGLCGHNRGSRHSIGSIKDLKVGDTIQCETSSGTRTYSVSYVGTIKWTDWSYLNATRDNRITIITCLADQPTKRVCVQATEVYS